MTPRFLGSVTCLIHSLEDQLSPQTTKRLNRYGSNRKPGPRPDPFHRGLSPYRRRRRAEGQDLPRLGLFFPSVLRLSPSLIGRPSSPLPWAQFPRGLWMAGRPPQPRPPSWSRLDSALGPGLGLGPPSALFLRTRSRRAGLSRPLDLGPSTPGRSALAPPPRLL